MASIYKPTGRKHYHTSFYVPSESGNKWKVTRSTGKSNRKDAQHVANDLEREALSVAGAGDEKGRKICAVIKRAAEEARKGMLNSTTGRQLICELVDISTGDELPAFNIREWVAEWLARQEGASTATLQAYTTYTTQFLDWMGKKASGTLQSVTTENMRQLRKWFQDGASGTKKASSATVKNKMKCVSSIFNEAMKQGLITHNPTSGLKKLQDDVTMTRKPLTNEEIAILLGHAPTEDWRGLILLGAFTGLRLSDCVKLPWGDVNFEKGEIETTPDKTRRIRTVVKIPLHETLLEFLTNHPISDNPKDPILPSLADKRTDGGSGLSTKFGELMEDAGIDRGQYVTEGGRIMHERSFHSLRHTLTSWLANSNVAPEVRMKILGQKSQDVHALYTHLGDDTLKAAMSGVPKIDQL